MESLLRDLRFAFRSLIKTPGVTASAVLTLAIGIGATTAIFSLLNGLMFKPLPVGAPEQLFVADEVTPETGAAPQADGIVPLARFSYPRYQHLAQAIYEHGSVAAMSRVMRASARRAEELQTSPAFAQLVSGEYFDTFRVSAERGRLLTNEDNQRTDGHPVAVLSHSFWQRRFGGTSDVLHRTIAINGVVLTIVGVAEPNFTGVWVELPVDVWIPAVMQHAVHYQQNYSSSDAESDRPWISQDGITWLSLVIRVPLAAFAQTRAILETAYRQDVVRYAETIRGPDEQQRALRRRFTLTSLARGFSNFRDQFALALAFLMALVTVLLLIACLNIANLLLARASARQGEIAVRLALGAGRRRIVQQLLVESLLISVAGSAAGLLIGHWTSVFFIRIVLDSAIETVPQAFAIDARVLGLAISACVVATVLFGLGPALMATDVRLNRALKTGGRGTRGGASLKGMRPLLVTQVAMSLVLVLSAGLFGRSLLNLYRLDAGFDRTRLVGVGVDVLSSGYSRAELPGLYQRLVERVQSMPGVESVAFSMCGLESGCNSNSDMKIQTSESGPPEDARVQENRVSARYFSTLGIRLVAGRDFDTRDTSISRKVAIVNESFARRYFDGENAIGRRFGYERPDTEIVGVIRDARVTNLRTAPVPFVYYPLQQPPVFASAIDVRVSGNTAQTARDLRRAITEVEPRLLITRLATMDEQIDVNIRRDRLVAYLTAIFGCAALLLACVGLYGVMSYSVLQRTSELGVRLALGAGPAELIRLVVSDGMRMVVAGAVIGLVVALSAGRVISQLLFGVSGRDIATYSVMMTVLVVVGLFACYFPARRASRLNPIAALRAD
jgi:predicted permease